MQHGQETDGIDVPRVLSLIEDALAFASLGAAPGTLVRRLEGVRFLLKGHLGQGRSDLTPDLHAAIADVLWRYTRWRQR